ncbi:hypothetical protein [Pseudonocardia sp. MH-G8]|uniref:hypothetical protein n=1 Tax=Pseudonocardia sp. MH-G8 TaxID=1854588 RepID=UPI000BA0E84C|nr:hypothetical protein [Pseudonocardia sp. MH-G8]OZM76116.1 hypothetical protein CFP66_42545 [Pseudonocardia sp. MH-G8]
MRYLPRVLGVLTATYSVAIAVRPVLLARPCGLTRGANVDPGVRVLVGGIGARDAAIGTAMVLAPRGPALRVALAARVAADAADALVFGTQLPARDRRPKVVAFALSWAALCALSARWADR